jgi:hypothetical protein
MKVKTEDLTNRALDWAVGQALKLPAPYWYSTDWSKGGPIIEREGIAMWPDEEEGGFFASSNEGAGADYHGPTPLIAAMRCFVASRLGEEVDIPDDLLPRDYGSQTEFHRETA